MSEATAAPASAPPSTYVAAYRMVRDVIVNDRKAKIGAWLLAVLVTVAIIGPYIAPHDVELPNTDIRLTGPTLLNIMGTDHIGRDLFSRIISGLTVSLMVATGAVVIAVIIGATFLREPFGRRRILAACLVAIGVVVSAANF